MEDKLYVVWLPGPGMVRVGSIGGGGLGCGGEERRTGEDRRLAVQYGDMSEV